MSKSKQSASDWMKRMEEKYGIEAIQEHYDRTDTIQKCIYSESVLFDFFSSPFEIISQ